MKLRVLRLHSTVVSLAFILTLTGCAMVVSDVEEEHSESFETCGSYETLLPELRLQSSVRGAETTCDDSGFEVISEGEWDKITDEEYKIALANEFYLVYPRLYERWGTGEEPKTIHLIAVSDTEDIACSWGNNIEVQVKYANENPNDIGYLSHELAHNVQSYPVGLEWWTEGMASYGGFRYFHWASPDTVCLIDQHGQDLINWRYEPYGECVLFFAYLDYRFPTTPEGPGLIDSVNLAVKNGEVTDDSDPYTAGNEFNNVVSRVTGYNTIEDIRREYVEDCISGRWVFTGFAGYEDNSGSDIDYPVLQLPSGDKDSAPASDEMIEYEDNVLEGSRVIRCSGYINEDERSSFLTDGDLTTKWCATRGDVTDVSYLLYGVSHFIVLDMGEVRQFDSYTLYNGGYQEYPEYNAASWELLVSEDGEHFRTADYQTDCSLPAASFEIGEVNARYVMLKVYVPDDGTGTVRLYELTAGSNNINH